jgi:CDP-glucose 4,6-dehydratase
VKIDPSFWDNKKVLVTGHTGFKGSWLSLMLARMGSQVTGLSLSPPSKPNLFELAGVQKSLSSQYIADINDYAKVKNVFLDTKPDVVIHLAAQSLVRRSYASPIETFSTNVLGTVHVLEAVRMAQPQVALFATTDKVYSQLGTRQPFRETDPLGGHDPYSASKAACEIAVESLRKSLLSEASTKVATARAGNVIGGGDWAEDRLLPDAIRAH